MHNAEPDIARLEVTLEPLGSGIDVLEAEWRELEIRADTSFFTSWTWVGSWLRSIASAGTMLILRARRGGQTMALATFGHDSAWRRGFVRSHALFLNEAGYDGQDVLSIEYNGIVTDRAHHAATLNQIAAFLLAQRDRWNEIYLHGTTDPPTLFGSDAGITVRSWSKAAPRVLLDAVRKRQGDYLGLLKSKPRYQVRRTLRLYESLGALRFEAATDLAGARSSLAELAALHTPYWRSRGATGSFSTDFELAFHDRLLEAGTARGEIQLIVVRAGELTVGCLYNFVYRGHVSNYQSGFDYALLDGHGNPGLVTHALAVEHNAALGHGVYDFMAGDHRYKRELCTDVTHLHWSVIQRQAWHLRLENRLRYWRQACIRHGA